MATNNEILKKLDELDDLISIVKMIQTDSMQQAYHEYNKWWNRFKRTLRRGWEWIKAWIKARIAWVESKVRKVEEIEV